MARSSLSYGGALQILTRDDARLAELEALLGSRLTAAVPFTADATVALLDPGSALSRLIQEITGDPAGRIKAAQGRSYYELLEAAHTVLAAGAFFEGFRAEAGPELDAGPAAAGVRGRTLPEELGACAFPMPSAVRTFEVTRQQVGRTYEGLVDAAVAFGLRARPVDLSTLRARAVRHALRLYEERFDRLASDLPEFAFRVLRQQVEAEVAELLARLDSLVGLPRNLGALIDRDRPAPRGQVPDLLDRLGRKLDATLGLPLFQSKDLLADITFPDVGEGFVSPNFRWAEYAARDKVSDEQWWAGQAAGADITDFLTRYLKDPASPHRPLLVLGRPGAGKTLLARVIAARLPREAFTTIVVSLRRVADADAPPHVQIEGAIEDTVRERLTWGKLRRESATTKVVIFDGFDELVQATGVIQSTYVERVAEFQADEWDQGHSVITIITSRTLVMDRTLLPAGTVLVHLDEFTDPQVHSWVHAVNRANGDRDGFRALSADELLRHDDLARQPLLLTLLAIYYDRAPGRAGPDLPGRSVRPPAHLVHRPAGRREGAEGSRPPSAPGASNGCAATWRWPPSPCSTAAAGGQPRRPGPDLACFDADADERPPTQFREPLGREQLVTAAFFFVSGLGPRAVRPAPQLRVPARHDRRLPDRRARDRLPARADPAARAGAARPRVRPQAGHRQFRALLAHQPLLKREAVVSFASELVAAQPLDREAVVETIAGLLKAARQRGDLGGVAGYEPCPYDPVRLLAAYTANLVGLAALATGGVQFGDLMSDADWASTVRLWRAGLDEKGQLALLVWLRRNPGGRITVERRAERYGRQRIPIEEARLLGDFPAFAHLLAGAAAWLDHVPADIGAGKFHAQVVELAIRRWPVSSLDHLTLYDERRYRQPAGLRPAAPGADLPGQRRAAAGVPGRVRRPAPARPGSRAGRVRPGRRARLADRGARAAGRLPVPDRRVPGPAGRGGRAGGARGAARADPAARAGPDSGRQNPAVERVGGAAERRLGELPLEGGAMSVEMVDQFADARVGHRTALWLLDALGEFGDLAWPRIGPDSMRRLLLAPAAGRVPRRGPARPAGRGIPAGARPGRAGRVAAGRPGRPRRLRGRAHGRCAR